MSACWQLGTFPAVDGVRENKVLSDFVGCTEGIFGLARWR
jgi:hypothetical protein